MAIKPEIQKKIDKCKQDKVLFVQELDDLKRAPSASTTEEFEALSAKIQKSKQVVETEKIALNAMKLGATIPEKATIDAAIKFIDEYIAELGKFDAEVAGLKNQIAVPAASSGTVDNAADLTTVSTTLAELKASATTLSAEITAFNKAKSSMTAEALALKEKDIQEKKAAFEAKKKEIQAKLDAIKSVRTNFNFALVTDPTAKKALEEQKVKDEATVTQYEKDLKALTLDEGGLKSRVSNAREGLGTGGKWAVGLGAGALTLWGLTSLFSSDDEDGDEESGEKKKKKRKKKGFFSHGIGKFLKIAGIAVAGAFGLKALRDGLKPETVRAPEEQKSDFDKLSEADKTAYNTFADGVNESRAYMFDADIKRGGSDFIKLGMFYAGKEEAAYRGVVPFAIDKTYSTVGDVISERGQSKQIAFKTIQEWETYLFDTLIKTNLSDLLGSFLMKVESFQVLGYKPGEDIAKYIKDRLKVDKDAGAKLQYFFAQFVETAGYLDEKRKEIRIKIVTQKLQGGVYGGKAWNLLTKEDQAELIEDKIGDTTWMATNVDPILKSDFEDKTILQLGETFRKYDIDNSFISPDFADDIKELDAENNELINYDENTQQDVFGRANVDIADGSLEASTQKELIDCAQNISEDAVDEQGTGFMQTYFQWLSVALNTTDASRQKYIEQTGGKAMLEGFVKIFADFKAKFASGKITAADIKSFKEVTDRYFAFKKDVLIAARKMSDINTENPNVAVRARNVYRSTLVSFHDALTEKMGFFERGAKLTYGFIVVGGTVYIAGAALGSKPLRYVGKNMIEIGVFVPKQLTRGLLKVAGCNFLKNRAMPAWYWSKAMADSADPDRLLKYLVMNGRITKEGALKMAAKTNLKSASGSLIKTFPELIRKYGVPTMPQVDVDLIVKYFDDANIRKLITVPDPVQIDISNRWKYNIVERKLKYDYEFDLASDGNVAKLKTIDARILTQDPSGKALKNALKKISVKDFDLLHSIANKPSAITSLNTRLRGGSLSAEEFGTFLGKNVGKLTDLAGFERFLAKVPSSEIKNLDHLKLIVNNWDKISARLTAGEPITDVLRDFSRNFQNISQALHPTTPAEITKFQQKLDADIVRKTGDMNAITGTTSADMKARKLCQAQIDDIKEIKLMVENMKPDDFKVFKGLHEFLNGMPVGKKATTLNKIKDVWELAKTDTDLLDALRTADVERIKTIRAAKGLAIGNEVIEVYEKVASKKAGKILALTSHELENVLELLMKGFARAT